MYEFTSGITFAYDDVMKNSKRLTYFMIISVFLNACASAPKKEIQTNTLPDWVNHPQTLYPDTRFLVAVGTSASRDGAIEDAKKQMAESFVVKVQSETKSSAQSSLDENTSGSVNGSAGQNVEKNLSLQTETFLRGAEVKEVEQVGSQYYALVALDKLKARSGLLLEANRIQGQLNPLVDELEKNNTTQAMTEAKFHLKELSQLYGEASALGMSALIDVSSIEARLARLQGNSREKNKKLVFYVKTIQGDERFERDIEACINERGGTVYNTPQAPATANRIEVSVIERPQHLPINGFQKIRFDLTAAVVEASGKMYRIQATRTETGRTYEAVLESVSDKISEDFCENLFSRMNDAVQN